MAARRLGWRHGLPMTITEGFAEGFARGRHAGASSEEDAVGSGPGRGGVVIGWRQVVGLIIAIVALVFVFENRAATQIRVLVPVVTMPLWLALLISLVLGFLVGLALSGRRGPRR
jgi:uncharacterized integral membrane protein